MMILVLLLTILIASTFTLIKAGLLYASPLFFLAIRMIAGGGLLLSYYLVRNGLRGLQPLFTLYAWFLVQIVLLHIYGAYVLEFIAIGSITAAKTCLLYSLTPFLTVLLSYVSYQERLTAQKMVALVVGFIGFLPILLAPAAGEQGSLFGPLSVAELLIMLSAVCSAQGWIAMRNLVKRGYSPIFINGFGMLVGGLLALATAYWTESVFIKQPSTETLVPLDAWLSAYIHSSLGMLLIYTLLLVIIANIVAYNLYGYLLKQYTPTFLAFANFITPLWAALYGYIFLAESVSIWFFVSVMIVGCGLYLFYQQELQK